MAETDKPTDIIHDVAILEGQGTLVARILTPPRLLGYLYESYDSAYVLLNVTESNSHFHKSTV